MTMKPRSSKAVIIFLALVVLATIGKCTEDNPQTTPPPLPQPDTAFAAAVKNAIAASNLTQTATTDPQWTSIINHWKEAIQQMEAVPGNSPNYPTAQQKITQYQNNLNYAHQKQTIIRQPHIQKGKQLTQQLKGAIRVSGGMTPATTLEIVLAKTDWDNLSPTDKTNITHYAQSLIPHVRTHPAQYQTDTPKDAPIYNLLLTRTANTCLDCWAIVTGDRLENGNLTIDRAEISGTPKAE